MEWTFILSPSFDKTWNAMGLGDAELQQLQTFLLAFPNAGDVIPGLSGVRKVRIPLTGRGKSGGGRVIYICIMEKECIHLLLAYPKNVQADLTQKQKQAIQMLVDEIKRE